MGKIHLEQDDITRLAEILKKDVTLIEDALIIDLGGPKLSLTTLATEGHFEQNGIRFDISAKFSNGELDVDID